MEVWFGLASRYGSRTIRSLVQGSCSAVMEIELILYGGDSVRLYVQQ